MNSNYKLQPIRVALTDGFAKRALIKETEYLLSLDVGRLMAGFYETAGLKTSSVRYGGWEDSLIGGHTLGHYLSALSLAATNPGCPEQQAALKDRISTVISGLWRCQSHSQGEDGFLFGAKKIEGGAEAQFDCVERGETNILTSAWVPWYTMHKLLQGLIDVYLYTKNVRAKEIASRLGDWVHRRVSRWNEETKERVLFVEYGGMNDALYALYSVTGKKTHLAAARIFDESKLFDLILSGQQDNFNGKHANTTVAKVLGAMNRYLILNGVNGRDERKYLRVAEAFFKTVTERHSYATGGVSEWEHFGRDYVLDERRTNCNCETCISYNLLKLARLLFAATGRKEYADAYDRIYTNSILSSVNPETGMTTYFQPMASGFFKVYSSPDADFWCCTGSGMESMSKLGDGMFYSDGENLYCEYYDGCVVEEGGIRMTVRADFPLSDKAEFTVEQAGKPFFLCLRIPDWCKGEAELWVNGAKRGYKALGGHIPVGLKEGDKVEVRFPVGITLCPLPDGENVVAFKYGGAVLSADLGTEDMETARTGVSVLIPKKKIISTEEIYFPDLQSVLNDPSAYFRREDDKFYLEGADIPLEFGLHYRRYGERYGIYWKLREGERGAEEESEEPLDTVQAGYGQYESDEVHAMKEENSFGETNDGTYRAARAGGYFEYRMKVCPEAENELRLTLREEDNGKPLKVTAGGVEIYNGRLLYTQGESEYPLVLKLPKEALEASEAAETEGEIAYLLPIRFEGSESEESAKVCGFVKIFAIKTKN